jgi:hypothetical protein
MNKSNKELRKFGITMAVALGVIAGIVWWRDKEAWRILLGLAGLFLVAGLALPRVLSPIEWAWMKLAHYLGTVMTVVLVTIAFLVAITPLGLLMRIFGKDLLNLKFDPKQRSYWLPVEAGGPKDRPDKPF